MAVENIMFNQRKENKSCRKEISGYSDKQRGTLLDQIERIRVKSHKLCCPGEKPKNWCHEREETIVK